MAEATVEVPIEPEAAFALFADRMGEWWPREYSWAGARLEWIGIKAGMCMERGPHGFRVDWGRVLSWEPPDRLRFSWQISPSRVPEPDPERASEVEVRFTPAEHGGTIVSLAHRSFDRHGEGWQAYEEAMASPDGWPSILVRYAAAGRTRAASA